MSTSRACYELCTESLGFESGDGSVGEGEEELAVSSGEELKNEEEVNEEIYFEENREREEKKLQQRERNKKRSFPPPLRWMGSAEGRKSSYMKSERKNGRLIITEVRVERPEVFQVLRENGRLRFCLAGTQGEKKEEEAREDEEEEKEDEDREPVRREGYCSYQGAWSGARMHSMWWHHGYVTTA